MGTLGNGEVGAIWLDGRYGEADTGSALFFASTIPEGGFGMDKMIGESTCECCRTDLLVDSAGRIHIAYRDILYPRSEEHTSELQSLMRISYAVFCLKQKNKTTNI